MGKDKEQKTETPGNAFSRMNYLYQASQLMTNVPDCSSLSNYYNKLMKEISKKVLEKLHPDLKRTMCCACNYPLNPENSLVKIKTHRKKKKKKDINSIQSKKDLYKKNHNNSNIVGKYSKLRVEARNKRPNKVWWHCSKCGYAKGFLQRPYKKLWIHEVEEKL